MRLLRRFVFGLAVLFGLYCTAIWALPGEYSNLQASSFKARLVIPKPLRTLAHPDFCAPPRFSTAFLECGGVCGKFYTVQVQSSQPAADLSAALALNEIASSLGATSVEVASQGEPADCPTHQITFVLDERVQ